MVSIATPTAIRSDVPPKWMFIPVSCPTIVGSVATTARKIAPTKEILLITFVRYSTVALPGLIPGINPPFCFMFCAISTGLNVTVV